MAGRVSSWRKPNVAPSSVSTPRASASSTASSRYGARASSSRGEIRWPATAATSTNPRASGPSRATRASVASRTDTGMAPSAATVSATRNGLPPVIRAISPASTPLPAARDLTASSDRGRRLICMTEGSVARSPMSTPRGWFPASSSSRNVTISPSATDSARRASNRTTSRVAGSAQWASSTAATAGPSEVRASCNARASARRSTTSSSGMSPAPTASASSRTGPSGSGTDRGSHRQRETRHRHGLASPAVARSSRYPPRPAPTPPLRGPRGRSQPPQPAPQAPPHAQAIALARS